MTDGARFDALLLSEQAIIAASHGDIDAIFNAAVGSSLSVLPMAEGAVVQLCENDELVVHAGSGIGGAQIGRRKAIDTTFGGRTIRSGSAMLCQDIAEIDGIDTDAYLELGIRSLISVPLVQHKRAVGTLKFLASRPAAFERKDVTIAQLVAAQVVSGLTMVAENAAVDALRLNEARFRAITEALPQGVMMMSPRATVIYINPSTREVLPRDLPDTGRIRPLTLIADEDREKVRSFWTALDDTPAMRDIECRMVSRDGSPQWVQARFVPIRDDQGILVEWLVTGIDIHARKTMEIALRDAVRTSELLLQEVNHRVKNSLQIATGLLALQADRIEDEQSRRRLLEAREQVATIAKVHQMMYRGARHDQVEFSALLRGLVPGLVGHASSPRAEVDFDLPEHLHLPLDQAVPLALVVTEIVTNALKHGGAGHDEELRITVALRATGDGIVMDIADNGRGFDDGFVPEESKGLGMEIIFGLSEQAGGTAEFVQAAAGVHFRLNMSSL